jgi:hypothetical protein
LSTFSLDVTARQIDMWLQQKGIPKWVKGISKELIPNRFEIGADQISKSLDWKQFQKIFVSFSRSLGIRQELVES